VFEGPDGVSLSSYRKRLNGSATLNLGTWPTDPPAALRDKRFVTVAALIWALRETLPH